MGEIRIFKYEIRKIIIGYIYADLPSEKELTQGKNQPPNNLSTNNATQRS